MPELSNPSRLLILDRDGTVNRNLVDPLPQRLDEVRPQPGVSHILRHYGTLGRHVVIVVDQGGVAFGYLADRQASAVHQTVLHALPMAVAASYISPHHPDGTPPLFAVNRPNRKPAP